MKKSTDIPWTTREEWGQTVHSIVRMAGSNPDLSATLADIAEKINALIKTVSDSIETICMQTCAPCREICCKHATIWYDKKDLLYLHFSDKPMPDSQIKRVEKDGESVCCHLSKKGCVLPRTHRPFVCTWYFCPVQKQFVIKHMPQFYTKIEKTLSAIKTCRHTLASEFNRISGNRVAG